MIVLLRGAAVLHGLWPGVGIHEDEASVGNDQVEDALKHLRPLLVALVDAALGVIVGCVMKKEKIKKR